MASLLLHGSCTSHLAVTGSPGPRDSPSNWCCQPGRHVALWVPSGWAGSVGQGGLAPSPFKGLLPTLAVLCCCLGAQEACGGKKVWPLFLSVMTFCLELTLLVVESPGRGGKPCGWRRKPQSARFPSMAQGCWRSEVMGSPS